MNRIELKVVGAEFEALAAGRQRATVRKDDREFVVGDEILMREFPFLSDRTFTGKALLARITHVCRYAGELAIWGTAAVGVRDWGWVRLVSLSLEVLEVGSYTALSGTTLIDPDEHRGSLLQPPQRVGRA